ncbi:MAG: hypothetical protein VB120_05395 [Lachnospiraceae bacterium]|nr:hypothetical protein [Lachnospiraceae bacterium]
MEKNNKKYYRVSKCEIFANPKDGVYITNDKLRQIKAFAIIFAIISFIAIVLNKLEKD